MLPVTSLYAGLLALYFVWLATRVVKARRIHRVPLGTPHRLVERAAVNEEAPQQMERAST